MQDVDHRKGNGRSGHAADRLDRRGPEMQGRWVVPRGEVRREMYRGVEECGVGASRKWGVIRLGESGAMQRAL